MVPVPVDLRKLSDIVKNVVVKKGAYNTKIKNIGDKILFQWWITNLRNISNALLYFKKTRQYWKIAL